MTDRRHRAPSKTHRHTRRALLLLLVLSFLLSLATLPAAAVPTAEAPVSADVGYAAIINLENNLTLHESRNADATIFPAATVKIMVALTVIEYFEQTPDKLETKIKVPAEVIRNSTGLTMELRKDEELSVYDLLCGMIITGANDAAYTLALAVDGSMDAFLERMNRKADALGMKNTVYYNVSGLDHAPSTTANDLLILGKYAFENETYMELAGMTRHVIAETPEHAKRTLYTRNYLLSKQTYADYYYAPATGMNAGATDSAGYCIVASAEINNQSYLCIVMGADKFENFTLAKSLFEWGSTNHQYRTLLSTKDILAEIPVNLADACDYVTVVANKEVCLFLPKQSDEETIEIRTELYFDKLTAPVKADMIVGEADVYLNGDRIDSVQLVTVNALAKDHTSHLKRNVINFLVSPGFLLTVAIIALCGVVYVLVIARIRYLRMVKQVMELPDEDEKTSTPPTPPKLPPKSNKDKERH